MEESQHTPIEEMEFFRRYVEVADWAWDAVQRWPVLARDTVGKQLMRAADSIGANLVEGGGRHGAADALHFFVIARASARETRYWLQRAAKRGLRFPQEADAKLAELVSATQLLNRFIAYRRSRSRSDRVSENREIYRVNDNGPSDPFAIEPGDGFSSLT